MRCVEKDRGAAFAASRITSSAVPTYAVADILRTKFRSHPTGRRNVSVMPRDASSRHFDEAGCVSSPLPDFV